MTSIPLSLYIHFPWCIKKCPYCDFNSHTLKGELQEQAYIRALVADFYRDVDTVKPQQTLRSIFLGGGTPSLFSGSGIGDLLKQIKSYVDFDDNIEITMETNPGAIEYDRFDSYLEAGVNRLSFGVQSFDPHQLKKLGRIHDAENVVVAVEAAKQAGFNNFNIDLMYGLPDQKIEDALDSCQQGIDLSPTHLSLYQLTLEPNTLFHKYPPTLPDQDMIIEMQNALIDLLKDNGYRRYEVSAYAKEGYQCQHNLNYWEFGDYLGIGAGAHSKLTRDGQIIRGWKQKHPDTYLKSVLNGNEYSHIKTVESDDVLFEFMMNALRLTGGFDLPTAEQRTFLSRDQITHALKGELEKNRIDIQNHNVRCTDAGYLFLDEILVELLPD